MRIKKERVFREKDEHGEWEFTVSYDEDGVSFLSSVKRVN